MNELGELITARRKKLGLTKTELAERSGATRQVICRLEKDPYAVSLYTIKKVLYELYLEAEFVIKEAN